MRVVYWLLVVHGVICLLGAFFPLYPPVFLFYWFFPGPFTMKLIIVLLAGAAQVVFGVYWAINRWKVRWYWLTIVVVIFVLLMLVFPVTEGLLTQGR